MPNCKQTHEESSQICFFVGIWPHHGGFPRGGDPTSKNRICRYMSWCQQLYQVDVTRGAKFAPNWRFGANILVGIFWCEYFGAEILLQTYGIYNFSEFTKPHSRWYTVTRYSLNLGHLSEISRNLPFIRVNIHLHFTWLSELPPYITFSVKNC